jgi:hypothetical protein
MTEPAKATPQAIDDGDINAFSAKLKKRVAEADRNALKSMARAMPALKYGSEEECPRDIARRLLNDPRMNKVWRYLMTVKVEASAIEALPLNQHLSNWDISDYYIPPDKHGAEDDGKGAAVSLNGRACAAFLALVALELAIPNKAAMGYDVENSIASLRSAAEQCRFSRSGLPKNDKRTTALSMVEEFFKDQVEFIEKQKTTNPYFLPRSKGGERDMFRVRVRAIAKGLSDIFGSIKISVVTRVANVALKTEIDIETVRDWCALEICQK